MKNACIVIMKCLTNLHVGDGDNNYNIIDQEVEKDPVTGYPSINSSGVKGALRSHFSKVYENKINVSIDDLFGSGSKEKDKHQQGGLKILGAEMIAIPQRASKGEVPYFLVTKTNAIERVNYLSNSLIKKDIISESNEPVGDNEAEGIGFSSVNKINDKIFGNEKIYTSINNIDAFVLPVIARNRLENGESKNLWYEEYVPHESIFCFGVIADNAAYLEAFTSQIDGQVVQFGGNASIGYGLCKLTVIKGGGQNE